MGGPGNASARPLDGAAPPPTTGPRGPLHLVMVHRLRPDGRTLEAHLRSHPGLANRDVHWHVARRPRTLPGLAADAARQAKADGGVLVAAGGDGTINTVSQAAWEHALPVGIVTAGTFNYFARQHALAESPVDALGEVLAALDAGELRPVQVGRVNDQLFLVNASVGAYPRLLAERERATRRFGRRRGVALTAAVFSLLRPDRGQRLLLVDDRVDDSRPMAAPRASTLFVGNNALQFEQVGLDEASAVARGALGAVILKPQGVWASFRMLWRAARGRLNEEPDVLSFPFQSMEVRTAGWRMRRRIKVAFDGEHATMSLPLRFAVGERPLWLVASRQPAVRTDTEPAGDRPAAATADPARPPVAEPAV